tara:strand:- start:49992 stop:52388 length:2397 start_codon:yes stop_codon:yes gene_type:complete
MSDKFIIYPESAIVKVGFKQIRQICANKAFTPYGYELIATLVPSGNPDEVDMWLRQASEWMKLLESSSTHPLSNLDDIREILKLVQIEGNSIPLDNFVAILQNARLARMIISYFNRLELPLQTLRTIVSRLTNLKSLEDIISKTVDDKGELKDDASPQLKQIRNRLNREQNKLRTTIQRVMRKISKDGMTSDEGVTIRNGRMVIPVLAEFKRKIDGFIHDVSSTGQTVYFEPIEALQINNEIRQLEAEEQREIDRIIRELTAQVRKFTDLLYSNIEPIAQLDSIHCRVQLGFDYNGSIPLLDNQFNLKLINARNPNLLIKQNESDPVIPLDMELHQDELGLVITGPNAGGKSVAMKTVGVLQLMFQSGYPIPVDPDSKMPVLSGLYVDIGDEQSIENDLSTFSSRLKWMRHSLHQLKPHALVLIDEAGSGTDPEEGGALFQSFVEKIIKLNSRVIVTTHHGSLKVFAHESEHVVNGAMEFNQKHLTPTYRFKKGIPGSSYAFEIADRMNLPPDLMDRARNLLGDKRDRMGDLLVSLEKSAQKSEEVVKEYESKLSKLEKREKALADQSENYEKKKNKILEKAYKDAEEIMLTANRRIEEAVEKVVNEGRENKKSIKEARADIKQTKSEIADERENLEHMNRLKEIAAGEKPVVGDFVLIGESDIPGELVEVSGQRATISMNGMRVKSTLDKLTKTVPPNKKKKTDHAYSFRVSKNVDLSVKPTLDLRGKRGEDAISELTTYLDKAIANGYNQVEIIHGKGEGILHQLVHNYLKEREEVHSFEIAPWDSGGNGCTIVSL